MLVKLYLAEGGSIWVGCIYIGCLILPVFVFTRQQLCDCLVGKVTIVLGYPPMDAEDVSWRSEAFTDADQSDSCSAGQTEGVETDPNDDKFLLHLGNDFQQSKSQQIQQFLRDQEELNRRFGEETLDDDNEGSNSETSEKSVKETEMRLKQRMALHRHPSVGVRAKTSMGFYNDVEFNKLAGGDEGKEDTSSDGETSDIGLQNTRHHAGYARPLPSPSMTKPVKQNRNNIGTIYTKPSVSVRHYSQFPHSLQPVSRPKTSIGRRSVIRPQITTVENKFSYETVNGPESCENIALQKSRSPERTNTKSRRSAFVHDNNGQLDPSMRLVSFADNNIRHGSLETEELDGLCHAIGHGNKGLVRPCKLSTETSNSLPSAISSFSQVSMRRRNILSYTDSTLSSSELKNRTSLEQRMRQETHGRKTAKGLNSNDLHKARGISKLNSFERNRRALAVHRLPPLESPVPNAPPVRNMLDPAC